MLFRISHSAEKYDCATLDRLSVNLITRQRARALAAAQEDRSSSESSLEWPEPPPPQPSRFRALFRSFRRANSTPENAHLQAIPTPSEGSEYSWCLSDRLSDSEDEQLASENLPRNSSNINQDGRNSEQNFLEDDEAYENVGQDLLNDDANADGLAENLINQTVNSEDSLDDSAINNGDVYENIEQQPLENNEHSAERIPLVSLMASGEVTEAQDDRMSRLCDAIERMTRASFYSQTSGPVSKTSVTFPIFRGDETEDVNDFIDNYKRAARLSGWSNANLAVGLPLYLRGNAAAFIKTLDGAAEMSFDDLVEALIKQFASGASEWRLRQTLAQRVQLENEAVSDYACSLRKHCARLNLPRAEWLHKFVSGLRKEIREYVVLMQPESLESAEELAKLKQNLLSSSEKTPVFDAKEFSKQVVEGLSKVIAPTEGKTINVLDRQSTSADRSHMRRMIRDEVTQVMGNTAPNSNRFQQRRNPTFSSRGFRPRVSTDKTCYNCGRRGHLHYYCDQKPVSSVSPHDGRRYNSYQGNTHQQRGRNNPNWNTNQSNWNGNQGN